MTRFHATAQGNIPFTPAEEIERDQEEAQAVTEKIAADKARSRAAIQAQLDAADLKIIRALAEGDSPRIAAHVASQAALRAKLVAV